MDFSLNLHARAYSLSVNDCVLSAVTGLSGAPYAKRHWELSNREECQHVWGHRMVAALESIPFVGALIALIERVSICAYEAFSSSSQSLASSKLPETSLSTPTPQTSFDPLNPDHKAFDALPKRQQDDIYAHLENRMKILDDQMKNNENALQEQIRQMENIEKQIRDNERALQEQSEKIGNMENQLRNVKKVILKFPKIPFFYSS